MLKVPCFNWENMGFSMRTCRSPKDFASIEANLQAWRQNKKICGPNDAALISNYIETNDKLMGVLLALSFINRHKGDEAVDSSSND